jgi:hypothetical protein
VGPVSQKMAADKFALCHLKNGRRFHSQDKAMMVNRPPASFFYERPPFRAAATTRRNLHYWQTRWDGFVAARRSWAAPGLSSLPLCASRHSNLHCMRVNIGNTPSISQMSVLEVPLCFICTGYHWGEAVKL